MLTPAGISWVGLYAEHLPTLATFYEKTVGFRVIERDQNCCIFDVGGGASLEIWDKGLASTSKKSAREQSVLVGFLVAQLEPVIEELSGRGLKPDAEIDSYLGARWIYYTDPEGNRFEFKDCNGQSKTATEAT